MKIPKVLNFVWIGGNIPPRVQERIDNFAIINPNCDVKIWSEESLNEFDIHVELQSCYNNTMKADLARFQIIAKYGGAYIDCDMIPISCMEHLFEYEHLVCCNEEPMSDHSSGFMSTGFFMAPPGDPIISKAASEVLQGNLNSDNLSVESGPYFFRKIINSMNSPWTRLPSVMVYPVRNGGVFNVPINKEKYPESIMVHYWGSIGWDLQTLGN